MNGPLIALLCAAYFVLVACALSAGQPDARAARAEPRDDREPARLCERRSAAATRSPDPEAPALAAYALTTMTRAARSRAVDQRIGSIVLDLRGRERCTAIRAPRRGNPASSRTPARPTRPITVGADEAAH